MNAVTTTWQQLVRRRLWPVALLLVAALAAVPFVLASKPAPVVPQADPAPVVTGDDELAEPVVAKVAAKERTRRRRVLGVRKDPFEPAPAPKKKKATSTKVNQTSTKQGGTPTGSNGSAPTTTSGGGSSAPSVPPVTEPPVRKPPAGSVTVRFGDATQEDLPSGWLTKLRPLPDTDAPLLVYMGLTKNGKKAKFLVDTTLTPTGDGTCKPHPASCETVLLSRGETEFFDVIDPESGEPTAQYQLDLVAINK